MSKNSGNSFFAFVSGLAAGAAIALLYAPEKGSSLRDKLSFQLEKYQDTLQQLLDDLLKEKGEAFSTAKSEGQKVIDDAISQAEALKKEVEALKSQISDKD